MACSNYDDDCAGCVAAGCSMCIQSSTTTVSTFSVGICQESTIGCATDETEVAELDNCPCSSLSQDCRDGGCLASNSCGWCGDFCCAFDDYTSAQAECTTCEETPTFTGYVVDTGNFTVFDTRDVTCNFLLLNLYP